MAEIQREWFEKDYYATLGVSEKASDKELTKAYRKLARKLHPDANPGDPAAEERFKEVSAAYDVVGDEDKRASYNEARRMGPIPGRFAAGGSGPSGSNGGFDNFGDLLGGLFGRGGRGGGRGHQAHRAQPGPDLEANLALDFLDAVIGSETVISIASEAACSGCSGTGSTPGAAPRRCHHCDGRGVIDDNQGMFSMSRPCVACGGRGSVITDPCATCGGRGREVRPREIKVRIPAGVKTGQKILLKGRGGLSSGGGPPGDLLVKIRVKDHALFGRSGADLTLEVPITFAEAALGADISVPTLTAERVKIRIPAGTATGKKFRVRGKGGGGDLLVTVFVDVPNELSDEQRVAVKALAAATTKSPRARLER